MKQFKLPARGPKITEYLGADSIAKKRLEAWGFLDRPRGSLAERNELHQIHCWAGRLTTRLEAPVLAAVSPFSSVVKEDWYFGIVQYEEIAAGKRAVEAILDAAVYKAVPVQSMPGGFFGALRGLDGIMPVSIQFDPALSE